MPSINTDENGNWDKVQFIPRTSRYHGAVLLPTGQAENVGQNHLQHIHC